MYRLSAVCTLIHTLKRDNNVDQIYNICSEVFNGAKWYLLFGKGDPSAGAKAKEMKRKKKQNTQRTYFRVSAFSSYQLVECVYALRSTETPPKQCKQWFY